MREAIRRLSPRAEFFIVVAIAFGWFIVSSTIVLMQQRRVLDRTTGRTIVGIAIEVVLLTVIFVFLRARQYDFDSLGLKFSFGRFFAGIPLFVMALVAYWFVYLAAIFAFPSVRYLQPPKMTVSAPFWLMAVFIVINSLFEESTVTAYIINALSHDGAALAITASTLVRFLYHLYQGPIASLWILPIGLLFGGVYWRWRNLWPLMVAHTILNVVSVAGRR